ncbi:MAG TPA: ThuA domain-containing protein, partial [Pirellulales bacterium]|nr:ThuA domain-containing protein [Pirellulales bacterium]
VSLYDAEQGVPEELLDFAEVLIWWGHVKHSKIEPATGRKIVERIVDGRLSLIALHSSHWATPFVEAMNERARQNARALPKAEGDHLIISEIPLRKRFYLPKRDEPLTPRMISRKYPDGRVNVDLYLPNCCFPAFRSDGKPSSIHVMKPQHPIVAGLPVRFELPETEMYDEPFHIPEPDVVVLEERWSTGEWFRSGSVWDLGAGKVFYFRPGHETYPVFRQAEPLKIVSNAAKWLAHELRKNGN